MKISLSMVVATTALMTFSHIVQACEGDSDFTGAVCFTAATYCPAGYLEANGQNVPVNQYQALYSLVGNRYGGTAGQNFNLPRAGINCGSAVHHARCRKPDADDGADAGAYACDNA